MGGIAQREVSSARMPALEDAVDPDGVTVVIPCFNEERGVGPSLEGLLTFVREHLSDHPLEVILVDDGSSDGTADALRPYESDDLRILRHPHNRGYGAAIKTGVRAAKYPWILITDADGTYPHEHIPELLAEREGHDMIVGARIGQKRAVPLLRRPPKWVLRKLASILCGFPIPDLNSGLRLMRRDRLEEYERILPNGFSLTTTITLAMLSAGNPVKYVPINYLKREGKSKIRPIADTLNFVRLILRTVMLFDPLRVFLPVALTFVLASIVVAVTSWFVTGQVMDVTTVLLFITGVHFLALGMLADTLNRRLH